MLVLSVIWTNALIKLPDNSLIISEPDRRRIWKCAKGQKGSGIELENSLLVLVGYESENDELRNNDDELLVMDSDQC